jgi:hypothetical protein
LISQVKVLGQGWLLLVAAEFQLFLLGKSYSGCAVSEGASYPAALGAIAKLDLPTWPP